MTLQSIPTRSDRVLSQRTPEMVILLDPDRGEYFSLDEIGGWLWDRCDGTRSLAALTAEMCDAYEVAPEVAEADVRELLAELTSTDLIRLDG